MRKVDWGDKKVIDRLKANGYIFVYLGGAIQAAEDYGSNWRRSISAALGAPGINGTAYDPTVVEPAKFGTTMDEWDIRKKKLKTGKKFREFYRVMGSVVHLDLYALEEAHAGVFLLDRNRTYGTIEEIIRLVLGLKRPTFIIYDDEEGLAHFSDWILERLLEAYFEHYVCFRIFHTTRTTVGFIKKHRDDILYWDKNYWKTMEVIRKWRAFCRELRWSNRRKVFPGVSDDIDAKLREIYKLLQEAKEHLRNCESIAAAEKSDLVLKKMTFIRKKIQSQKAS